MEINQDLINDLLAQAEVNPRLRQSFDLRTSPNDSSQRILNAMMPGTQVAIHRHPNSTESVILISGKMDEVLYEEDNTCPNDQDFPKGMDSQEVMNSKRLKEIARYHLDCEQGNFGCAVPKGVWHTVEIFEPSVIFEVKDGKYGEDGSQTW